MHNYNQKEKLVVFGNSGSFITYILLSSLVKEVRLNYSKKIELVCFVDTINSADRFYRRFKLILLNIKYLVSQDKTYKPFLTFNIRRYCRKNKLKFLIPVNSSINDNVFINDLKGMGVSLALVLGCPQIMKKDLINIFKVPINYHNSLLPKYRGVFATYWAVYFNEVRTGFTFHIINEKIDSGNIFFQDYIQLESGEKVFDIEISKTQKAASYLNKVLYLMLENNQGKPQEGSSSYYGYKEINNIRCLEIPSTITSTDLIRRIDIFGYIKIKINDKWYFARKLSKVNKNVGLKRNYFATSDGDIFKINLLFNLLFHYYYRNKEKLTKSKKIVTKVIIPLIAYNLFF